MPASPNGFGDFLLGRTVNLPVGYPISVMGCPQPPPQLAAVPGVPLPYPGLQGYSFIPYAQHRHMAQMNNPYDVKTGSPYHQALLGRAGPFYTPYRPVSPEDPSRVPKAATRESTGALKAWLNEHLKNPYPTKGEKIMLAIVTKMSLTQVSTWFANARRRLKKENRVGWASRGKSDEEEEDEDEEEVESEGETLVHDKSPCLDVQQQTLEEPQVGEASPGATNGDQPQASNQQNLKTSTLPGESPDMHKPKIWSLAETATSDTGRKCHQSQKFPTLDKWWAEWASWNGQHFPLCYPPQDLLKHSSLNNS